MEFVGSPITKVTQVFPQADGSEARVVVESMTGLGLVESMDIRVHQRSDSCQPWQLRPSHRGLVSPAQMLRLTSMIGKPLDQVG